MTDKKKKRGEGGPPGRGPQIDTAALLSRVDIVEVINARVPLAKSGAEYEARCPFHTEETPSFKVSPSKQFYHCFGCGANGDAIKFLVEHDGMSFLDACRELGADVPEPNAPPAERQPKRADAAAKSSASADSAGGAEACVGEEKKRTDWVPILPVPADAPAPPAAHVKRGKPGRTWTYLDAEGRLLGYVCRFEKSSGGKEVIPLTWCRHEVTGAHDWRWISFPEPGRPLYGLDRLAAKPAATVLLVEGEKCADAAQEALPELVAVAWPGGGKAVGKVDWSPLAGRKVMAWADCDAKHERLTPAEKQAGVDPLSKPLKPPDEQPGVMAMAEAAKQVLALAGTRWWDVKIPAPGEKPDGWDIADAIAEGLTGAALADFLRAPENRSERQLASPPETASTPSDAGAGKEKKAGVWIPDLIYKKDGLAPCLSNVYQILAHRPEWRGVVAYDEFALCVVKRRPPPFAGGGEGEWDSTDDSRGAMWLQREYSFTPSSAVVAEAVEVLARANAWHPVRAWLRSLEWDGEARLTTWLSKYLGVELTKYTARVAKWWLMGAVKRVLQPGCKFDYCLVLEGPQGKGKSTALAIIGGDWFGDTDLDLAHKDSMSALRGKLVYEIAELGALARSEEKRQKSFLSRRIDEYRPVYGRREIKAPRQLVFGGSTNEFEWNKDPTGGRRFWPVMCAGEFDLDGLRDVRDQLFAEALLCVEAGQRLHPTSEEQKEYFDPEQLRVEQQDSLVDALHDWVFLRTSAFSLADAAFDGLKLDASKLTRDLQTRLGVALRKLGCRRVEKRNGMTRFWYEPPERKGAESKTEPPAPPSTWSGGEHVPF